MIWPIDLTISFMVYQRRTDFTVSFAKRWACSSAGEHYVDIVGVTGSIPVTPTIFSSDIFDVLGLAAHGFCAQFTTLSGVMVHFARMI